MCGASAAHAQPIATGRWTLRAPSPVVCVHAALLVTGDVLCVAGGGNDAARDRRRIGWTRASVERSALYLPLSDKWRTVRAPIPERPALFPTAAEGGPYSAAARNVLQYHDLFCSGHALMADGRVMFGGGTEFFGDNLATSVVTDEFNQTSAVPIDGTFAFGGFSGERQVTAFDVLDASHWSALASFRPTLPEGIPNSAYSGGRWYPTLLTLPDGRIMAMGGLMNAMSHRESTRDNPLLEVYGEVHEGLAPYQSIYNGWTPSALDGFDSVYPRLHVLPDGSVLNVSLSERMHACAKSNDCEIPFINPAIEPVPNAGAAYLNYVTSTVLLPLRAPAYRAQILAVGGGASGAKLLSPLDNNVWSDTPAMAQPTRSNVNATLLPDGNVFVNGGVEGPYACSGPDSADPYYCAATGHQFAIRASEMYASTDNRWTSMAEATVARDYHSTALLLPDGSVWTAGSNIRAQGNNITQRQGVAWPGNRDELRVEVFEPPYMFSTRPVLNDVWTFNIDGVWRWATADRVIQVGRDGWLWVNIGNDEYGAPLVERMVLVRNGSTTHSFNADQRMIELDALSHAGSTVFGHVPSSAAIMVPGPYMLFALWQRDGMWVPSVARMVLVR